ncbi:MAG TPA: sigma factor-like helix-turn-helix DNA-binding protein [Kofleriaceae bacterium]|nr:sigma factor-like helix-turn-helix DNA-binding protein [Kofleriaceae bacterium]
MTASTGLASALESGLAPDIELGDRAAVETSLAAALATARETWPDVRIDGDAFAGFVAERLAGGMPASAALERLWLGDLALASACASGDVAAIQTLDRMVSEQVAQASDLARAGATTRDEAAQVVRTLLLVPRAERPPAILDYAGRGPLGGWLRITATREVVRLLRPSRREVELGDHLVDGEATAADPVLSGLKNRYRRELADAFHTALAELGPRDRTLLRYQLVDGLGIDDIAALYQVHRATAARWLARVRDDLIEATRALLAEKLGMGQDEVVSVLRLVQSELDFSVIPHLRDSLETAR